MQSFSAAGKSQKDKSASSSSKFSHSEGTSSSQPQNSDDSFSPQNKSSSSNSHLSDMDCLDLTTVNRRDSVISISSRMSDYDLGDELLIPYGDFKNLNKNTLLGKGSVGVVYRAKWNNRSVAVKVLRQIDPENINQVDAFLREAQQTVQLKLFSPHVIKLVGICATPPEPCCLVLELMPGGSLYDFLRENSIISWPQRLGIALDIINGLIDLFRQNVILPDLKSSNILLTVTGLDGLRRAKLADFDSVIVKSANSHCAKTQFLSGTIPWMPPELLELEFSPKKKNVPAHGADDAEDEVEYVYNAKTIIYTFGWLLWTLLSHKTPFEFQELHSRNLGMLNQIIKDVIEGTRAEIPIFDNSPNSLEYNPLILYCWDAEPGLRPTLKDARQVLNRLK